MGLISIGTAAQILGVHADTVREWTEAGRIAAQFTEGGHRRYEQLDVERLALIQRGLVTADGEPWDIGLATLQGSSGMFAPAQLILLAGKTGTGKTTVGEYLIEQTLLADRTVMYVQLELSRPHAYCRFIARRDARHTVHEWMDELSVEDGDQPNAQFPQNLLLVTNDNALADDYKAINVQGIERTMCELSQREGKAIDMVYIDHLGLVDDPDAPADMLAHRRIMTALKQLALTSGALIVVSSNAPKASPADRPLTPNDMMDAMHMCDGAVSVHKIDDAQLHMQITKSRFGAAGGAARLKMNWAQASVEMCVL